MERTVLVSNRLPFTVDKRKGILQYLHSVGGLSTGLESYFNRHNSLWIGWPGINNESITTNEAKQIKENLWQEKCIPVFLDHKEIDDFYNGFSNKTIWPLFHYFQQHTIFDPSLWDSYVSVNIKFADIVLKNTNPDDTIWVHDYQLMLLPAILRKKLPNAKIGFFLHIPFPSFEIFRLLPWRNDILEGLLGADLIGFHTFEYISHFLNSTRRILGCDHIFNQIIYNNRILRADVFPMGIDYQYFSNAYNSVDVKAEENLIRNKVGNISLILSVDRLDYTKGIIQRLQAYDLLLTKNPQLKEKVALMLVQVPSRVSVDSYKQLKKEIDEMIGRINGKHGIIGWTPVFNLYRSIPLPTLLALYHTSEVALVTPLRDGMNLVAKEYVATKNDKPGVLILSEMAGAAREMGEALTVNPNDIDGLANAIKVALEMPQQDQLKRLKLLQKRLIRYDIKRWVDDFMTKLDQTTNQRIQFQAKKFTLSHIDELINIAENSKRILILLDFDGTLVPIAENPDIAIPDEKLLEILNKLQSKNEITTAIVSGRNKEFLQHWFGSMAITLCAEHGIWIKEPYGDWRTVDFLKNNWKEKLLPLLELYVDRTPGAILEQKDYSLAFHFRNSDPDLVPIRIRELIDALIHQISNLNLCVMEGKKVIEIKNAGIDKGSFALKMIKNNEYDLIIAIGDDTTDEYLFSSLPENAYSIKVGSEPSKARFYIDSVFEVRELLDKLSTATVITQTF